MRTDADGKKKIIKTGNPGLAEGEKGGPAEDRMGKEEEGSRNDRYYGAHYRIGMNQHNINLTLDEKRALVLPAARTWPRMNAKDGDDNPVPYYKGHRGATKGPGRGLFPLGFDVSRLGTAPDDDAVATEGGMYKDATGNIIPRTIPYTNPSWPYGTGYYRYDYPNGIAGSHKVMKKGYNSGHYVKMGDFIGRLPNNGFFTTVNNDN